MPSPTNMRGSWTDFILLQTHDGGLDGLDVPVNAIFIFLSNFILLIPTFHGIVNTFELVVC